MDDEIIIDLRESADVTPIGSSTVPFLDLSIQHQNLEEEIIESWRRLLRSGAFIGGEPLRQFEESLADYVGSQHAVGVANGTDAIMLALKALNIEPGDEVITAANTFFATAEAISHAGGEPVLVDVDQNTATIDPAAVEAAVTSRTRFIVPVHLYGQPADMDAIQIIADKHDLLVVEDNAQAIGARFGGQRVGSFGDAAAFSFYPGKNLGATGDAGAVTTARRDVAERVSMFADHGSYRKYEHVAVGHNSRLDAIHAAALTIKLKHLDGWNARRRYVADRYQSLISAEGVLHPVQAEGRTHVFHLYVIRLDGRDQLREDLQAKGVASGMHYPIPLHLTEPYGYLGVQGEFPNSEDWASRGLSLPIFPEMTDRQIETVAEAVTIQVEGRRVLTRDTA